MPLLNYLKRIQSYHVILLTFFMLVLQPAEAQNRADSILALVANLSPEKQVDTLNSLASDLLDGSATSFDLAYLLAKSAYEKATVLKYSAGQISALTYQGYYFVEIGDIDHGRTLLRQASRLNKNDFAATAYAMTLQANVLRGIAEYDSAYYYYLQASALIDRVNDHRLKAYLYRQLGILSAVRWKVDTARGYFLASAKLFEKYGRPLQLATTWLDYADALLSSGNLREGEAYMQKGCELIRESNNRYAMVSCKNTEGYYYLRIGEYRLALKSLMEAQKELQGFVQPRVFLKIYRNIGDSYVSLGENSTAISFYLEALKLAERQQAKREVAEIKASMAWIHKNQLNFIKSEELVSESLDLYKSMGDELGESNCYNVYGVLNLQQHKLDEAHRWLEKSLAIRRRIGYDIGVSAGLFNLAEVYKARKEWNKALEVILESLEIERKIGNHFELGMTFTAISELYTQMGKYVEAESYLKRADIMAMLTKSRSLRGDVALAYSRYYEAKKDFPMSLQYFKSYKEISDSLLSEASLTRGAEMEALYELNKKNLEIEALQKLQKMRTAELEGQRNQNRLQRALLIAVVVVLLSVSLLAIISYRYSRRLRLANFEINEQKEEILAQSEELIEANQTIAMINDDLEKKVESRTADLRKAFKELDTFFYRSSHDFRRPLTTFMGLAEVAKVTVRDTHALELFEKVKVTAQNLDKMLYKLQSISDVGSHEMVLKPVYVPELVSQTLLQLQDHIAAAGITVHTEFDDQAVIVGYPAMIKIIIENLIENSINFGSMTEPFIRIRTAYVNGEYAIQVADNGEGIPANLAEKIYEMYFRGSERSRGNGLGLYIVRKALEKLDGRIEMKSQERRGTVFTIWIPAQTV